MLAFRSQKQARRRFFAFESVFHGNLAFLAVSLCPPVHFIEHFHEGHTGGIIFAVQSVSAEIERTMIVFDMHKVKIHVFRAFFPYIESDGAALFLKRQYRASFAAISHSV